MLDSIAGVPERQSGIHHQLANLAVYVLDIRAVVAAAVRVIRVVGTLDFLCVFHAFKRAIHGMPKRRESIGGNRCHRAVSHRSVLSQHALWASYATAAELSKLSGVEVLHRADGALLAVFQSPFWLARLTADHPDWTLEQIVTT